jgi:hypothetical protein
MRSRFGARPFLALAIVAVLAGGLMPRANGAGGGHPPTTTTTTTAPAVDFIIRCFYNGNAVTEDPIEDPGSAHTDHLHIFFGNMVSGGTAGDGTTFPDIHSGDYSTASDTMESNGLSPATNCQDTKDTAGYWVPEPYLVTSSGSPSVIPTLGSGCSTNCTAGGQNPDFYQRDYYIPHGSAANEEIPDGTIMIAGYPFGCANVNNYLPTGCSSTGSPSYPVDVSGVPHIVEYDCGAAPGQFTPISAWPYNCAKYTDADDPFDGVVAMVNFPDCWNGQASFPAPNSPSINGLPEHMVPGYIAPWIPTPPTWKQKYPNMSTPANDFDYPPAGGTGCTSSNFPDPVVQLSERTHLLVNGADWGAPSTCDSDTGTNWNSLSNPENSPTPNPNDTDGDNDATVEVSTNPVAYGFQKCVAASVPTLFGTPSTLSFACTSPGDPNCDIRLPSPAGCGSKGGTCYVGAYTYGWETLHADYWQTWQEAASQNNNLDTQGGYDNPGDVGTLGDLVEDCADPDVNNPGYNPNDPACGFISTSNSTPTRVYGTGAGAP